MHDAEQIVHVVNHDTGWRLCETPTGTLTDGEVSEELQRDIIRQMTHWLSHFPERLPAMEALTADGRAALSDVRRMDLWDGRTHD